MWFLNCRLQLSSANWTVCWSFTLSTFIHDFFVTFNSEKWKVIVVDSIKTIVFIYRVTPSRFSDSSTSLLNHKLYRCYAVVHWDNSHTVQGVWSIYFTYECLFSQCVFTFYCVLGKYFNLLSNKITHWYSSLGFFLSVLFEFVHPIAYANIFE